MPSSPISGLSTIIHLLIILLAEILIAIKLFWRKHITGQAGANFDSVAANAWIAPVWVKRALSIVIVFFMLAVMILFGTATILKAMKLRAEESHSQYIQKIVTNIQNVDINFLPLYASDSTVQYVRAERAEQPAIIESEPIVE